MLSYVDPRGDGGQASLSLSLPTSITLPMALAAANTDWALSQTQERAYR